MTDKLASQEIRETKALLMETGWTQHTWARGEWSVDDDGAETLEKIVGYCILGALGVVQRDDYEYYAHERDWFYLDQEQPETYGILMDTVKTIKVAPRFPDEGCYGSVPAFNDSAATDFNKVCDFLDKAEKLALIREESVGG